MAIELGKNIHEAEKDLAAQKELYAAFLQLMAELLKSIPGFNSGINIQKEQGLTIERKPKGQVVEDIIEIEQKPIPEPVKNEPSWGKGTKLLYGIGQNNLTSNDIKAIASIIAAKKGDTVIGGEGLIIKYNGKALFETDEKGKISLHTAVSPQIKEKFAALQAGEVAPILPNPSNAAIPGTTSTPKAQEAVTPSQLQGMIGNAFAQIVSNLPAVGVPKPPENIVAPTTSIPIVNEEKQVAEAIPPVQEVVKASNIEIERKNTLVQAELTEQPSEAVAPPKTMLNKAGDYVAERAKRDTQIVSNIAAQIASDLLNNVTQGLSTAPSAINDQYTIIKTMLTKNVVADGDPNVENSINEFMDQVGDMFDELQQDDPNLGLSANNAIDEAPAQEALEPVIESPDQAGQAPAIRPAKLKTISIEDALQYMNERDDGGKAKDGRGYNLNDTSIGNKLTAQIDYGEPLDKAQAEDALVMLKKYHRQFAEGGVKLPNWESVQSQYVEPVYTSSIDPRAIFARQQQKLDETLTPLQQQMALKAAYNIYLLNMPEQNTPITQPGISETPLPTGAKFVNDLTEEGVNNLFIERDGDRILLGGIYGSNYTPVNIPRAMPELRQLRPFLTEDYKISPEPVRAIPLNQPLPTAKNDAAESAKPKDKDDDLEKEPYTIKPEMKLMPYTKPAEQEVAAPARSRGGR